MKQIWYFRLAPKPKRFSASWGFVSWPGATPLPRIGSRSLCVHPALFDLATSLAKSYHSWWKFGEVMTKIILFGFWDTLWRWVYSGYCGRIWPLSPAHSIASCAVKSSHVINTCGFNATHSCVAWKPPKCSDFRAPVPVFKTFLAMTPRRNFVIPGSSALKSVYLN